MAVPQPAAVASDPQTLSDERRYDVAATIIASVSSDQLLGWIAQEEPWVAELRRSTTSSTSTFPPVTGRSSPGPRHWGGRSWRRWTGPERRTR